MGERTTIEWCDATFNPWLGCTRVSAGCGGPNGQGGCYAEAMLDKRLHAVEWGPKGERKLTSDANWRMPLRWSAKATRKIRVFCASLADVFDDHTSIRPEWRVRLWELIAVTPNIEWLLLTKRPENWPLFLPCTEPRPPFMNIRLGVTIEDQAAADERGPVLQFAADLGWKTFVSYEPALGPVDWTPILRPQAPAAGWLIAGSESGPGARPCDLDWIRSVRNQCVAASVAFFWKQHVDGGHKISTPDLDGRKWVELPR